MLVRVNPDLRFELAQIHSAKDVGADGHELWHHLSEFNFVQLVVAQRAGQDGYCAVDTNQLLDMFRSERHSFAEHRKVGIAVLILKRQADRRRRSCTASISRGWPHPRG